jgi:hypothetical protein
MTAALLIIVIYDWYGPEDRRLVIVRLFSSIAVTSVADLALVQIPEILRYLVGPFSADFCFFHYVLKNTFAFQQILYYDIALLFRYLFIFILKNPTAFQASMLKHFFSPRTK